MSGKKLTKVLNEHLSLIEAEANNNNPQAMFLIGRIYQTSEQKDLFPQAKEWLHKAAEMGEARAWTNLFNQYSSEGSINL